MVEIPVDAEGRLVEILDFLGKELEPSILIGGWATVRRVGGEISHDIDLIIGSDEVRAKVESALTGLSRSTHLQGTKWRGDFDGVHVDVYIPHQSQLGAILRLKVEELARHTEDLDHGSWRLLTIEAHTISKMAALLDRPDTEKGFKDAREILRLLEKGVDPGVACDPRRRDRGPGRGPCRPHRDNVRVDRAACSPEQVAAEAPPEMAS